MNDVIFPYTLSHLIYTRPLLTNLARMRFEAMQFLLQFGKNEQGKGVVGIYLEPFSVINKFDVLFRHRFF